MSVLELRKGDGTIGGADHLFYYNRQFACSLRPANQGAPDHDPYAPGLHHLCFRLLDEAAVDRAAARGLREVGVEATEPRYSTRRVRPGLLRDVLRGPRRGEAGGDELPGDQAKGLMYDWEARAGL